jgi:hypothetical protein
MAQVLSSPIPVHNSTELTKKSKSKLYYDWRFTANQFFAPRPFRPTTRIFFLFQLNICDNRLYVTFSLIKSKSSQSNIATDGQSVSKSWCRAPSGAHDQIFITLWQLRSFFLVGRPLWREDGCLLYMLLALASVVFLRPESLGTRDHICLRFETSLFVASYDSQGHGGGIRHTFTRVSLIMLQTSRL